VGGGRRSLNALIIFELFGFKCLSGLCAVARQPATTLEITLSPFRGIKPLSAVADRCPFAISLRLSGISVLCNYSERSKLGNCPLKNHSNYLCLCVAPPKSRSPTADHPPPTTHLHCISQLLSSPDLRPHPPLPPLPPARATLVCGLD